MDKKLAQEMIDLAIEQLSTLTPHTPVLKSGRRL